MNFKLQTKNGSNDGLKELDLNAIKARGIHINPFCLLCEIFREILQHILFICGFVSESQTLNMHNQQFMVRP